MKANSLKKEMTEKNENIVWHHGSVTPELREKKLGQKGAVLWMSGLSGSGKSTVAHAFEEKLIQKGRFVFVLDGDNIRHGLNKGLGFDQEDRQENIRRVSEVAKLFCDANAIVIVSFISPYRQDRQAARSLIPQGQFFEVYCKASLELCEQRDPKGLYKKARAGEIENFTGLSAPYEEPENPEIVLNTGEDPIDLSCERLQTLLESAKIY